MATNSTPFKFSNDLLILIMKQVDDTKTLAALSLCSKTFHALVEPRLYSVINLRFDSTLRFVRFLRTIFRNPTLGQRVKILHWDDSIYIRNMRYYFDKGLFETQTQGLIWDVIERTFGLEALKTAQIGWNKLKEEGYVDILFAVLLCHLPNIKELDFVVDGSLNKYLEMVLGNAASLQIRKDSGHINEDQLNSKYRSKFTGGSKARITSFSKLSKVSISIRSEPMECVGVMQTLPFLSLLSLKSLSISWGRHADGEDDFDLTISQGHRTSLYKFPYPQFSFGLTSLSLQWSLLSNRSLTQYLLLFTCLKQFGFERNHLVNEWIEPQQILDSLKHSSKTLEYLHMSDEKSVFIPMNKDTELGNPMSSLASFPKLKVIVADCWTLVGQGEYAVESFLHLFPGSLESLTIKRCTLQSLSSLICLLEESPPPRLLKVKVTVSSNLTDKYCGALRQAFTTLEWGTRIGVEFGVGSGLVCDDVDYST